MFKGMLPKRERVISSEFTMVTNLLDDEFSTNGKENKPDPCQIPLPPSKTTSKQSILAKSFNKKRAPATKGSTSLSGSQTDSPAMIQAFDKLLDDLQIPSTLRPKLATMDSTVKAAMLKSSQNIVLSPPLPSITASPPRTGLRQTRSTDSLNSPRKSDLYTDTALAPPPPIYGLGLAQLSAHHPSTVGAHNSSRKTSGHARGTSFSFARNFSRSQGNLATPSSTDLPLSKGGKEKVSAPVAKDISPTKFFSILSGTSSTQLDVENIKKLRLLLRNESAGWSQEFLSLGGYSALLTRLNEILEVEWREEQHDDHVLHELLRCVKALSTSSIGCFALRSSCPTPFVQLVALLYSDKKPGEVATRQLIVDLLLILFELYPASALPSHGQSRNASGAGPSRRRREAWESSSVPQPTSLVSLPAPHKNFYSLIRALLLTPAPPPSESPAAPVSPHAFIESLHLPRIYKTYLGELSDVCRDYFWVFCHPNNTIWVLSETDEQGVERPRAPGGMTGGVEFEAMGYFTTHLKLLNAIAQSAEDLKLPKEHDLSAHRFHSDLFLSGIERILLISRKASTAYYPTLHLELARYIAYVGRAEYELPWTVSRLIGMPPTNLAKDPARAAALTAQSASSSSSPSKRVAGAPALPPPKKMDAIKLTNM